MLRLITLFLILSLNAPAASIERSPMQSLYRRCYRLLIAARVLENPIEIRAHVSKVRKELERLTGELSSREAAEFRFLENLGYDPSLVRRWASLKPELIQRVIFHPNNRPTLGYRILKVEPGKFRTDHKTVYPFLYFTYDDSLAMKYVMLMGFERGTYIQERMQIPKFACGRAKAFNGDVKGPTYPIVSPDYTKDLRLLLTHLRFPDGDNVWHAYDDIIVNNRIIMPNEPPPVKDD